MKKTLVALAALAATSAFAQSTVTLSGIVDLGYQQISNLGGQNTNQVGQNGARTSTFKFNGVEDLGGGLNANFQFEVQPSYIASNGNAYNAVYPTGTQAVSANGTANATNAASAQSGLVGKGQNYIGLTDAKYGTVQFGTINTATFGAFAAVSQLGTGIGSGYGSGNTFGDFTRYESSAAYKSPVINGFDFSLLRGTGNDSQFGAAGTTSTGVTLRRPTVTDIGIGYANGPVAVKFGRLASKATGAEAGNAAGVVTTTQLLGGVYDAGFAKFSLATGTQKGEEGAASTTKADYKLRVAAVTVPFGANRVIAQAGDIKIENGGSTVNVGAKSKTTGIALERDLSKRTYAYVRYEATDLAGFKGSNYYINGAAGTAAWGPTGSKRAVTSVGISHAF